MSHHSYQPTQSCGSKLLQQKWDTAYYKEHRRLVKSARPMVDTSSPAKPPHIVAKWKKQQLEKERAEEIDRDNHTLMTRMKKIMTTRKFTDARRHHSLNEEKRQREMERVARENKAMLQRLEKVQPVYRISDWIDDWQKSEELTQRITAYPPPRTPTRSKSAPLSGKRKPSTPVPLQPDTAERETGEPKDNEREGDRDLSGKTETTETGRQETQDQVDPEIA